MYKYMKLIDLTISVVMAVTLKNLIFTKENNKMIHKIQLINKEKL